MRKLYKVLKHALIVVIAIPLLAIATYFIYALVVVNRDEDRELTITHMQEFQKHIDNQYESNGSFEVVCEQSNFDIVRGLPSVAYIKKENYSCFSNVDFYLVSSPLKKGDFYCIDSSGFGGLIDTQIVEAETLCDGSLTSRN